MALNPNVVVVSPGELITAEHLNNIRANLDRLDTTKLALTGGTVSGNVSLLGQVWHGGSPASQQVGVQVRPDGIIIARTVPASINNPTLQLIRAGANSGANSVFVSFERSATDSGAPVQSGTITVNAGGNGVVYNTTSDSRLKSDVGALDPADVEAALLGLRVRRFVWDDDPDAVECVGLFAQETAEHVPDVVTPGGDNPYTDPWSIDLAGLVPRLLAQVQYLTGRVAELEGSP